VTWMWMGNKPFRSPLDDGSFDFSRGAQIAGFTFNQMFHAAFRERTSPTYCSIQRAGQVVPGMSGAVHIN